MASLLPAIPTDWRATRPPHDVIPCRRCTAVTDAGNKCRDTCIGRWGTEKRGYGGVGRAADHVIRKGGVTSRSHRHYGSGIFNYSAQVQPYQITDLLLSDSRPCDQRLPPPLLTNKINLNRQLCEYPGNHMYTSHRSKFAVFPLAEDQSPRFSALTQGATEALKQIHHNQFCTTTYQETYTNPWNHKATFTTIGSKTNNELVSDSTSRAEESNRVRDKKEEEKAEDGGGESGGETNVLSEADKVCEEEQNENEGFKDGEKKKVHWGDQEDIEQPKKDGEEEEETEKDSESVMNEKDENSEKVLTAEEEFDKEKEKLNESVAMNLPQLPFHFRRVSSKYCRNQLSPIWPCSIPYYLSRPHSTLQSLIPRPPISFHAKGTAKPVYSPPQMVATMEEKRCGRELRARRFPDDVIAGDVIGESPPVQTIGSRIPLKLGVRFKAQAHSRYHQLYPDKIPDLRDSRVENKKYFFFGFHSSILR